MSIGSTLKLLRTASSLKQNALANDLKVTANYLSLVENDRKEPSLTLLKKFSKRMNVPLGYLLWLALEEGKSPEERDLKGRMNNLLIQLMREKKGDSTFAEPKDKEENTA
jgi:XRE family transcriptional regulator, regulator of sulfur utilization